VTARYWARGVGQRHQHQSEGECRHDDTSGNAATIKFEAEHQCRSSDPEKDKCYGAKELGKKFPGRVGLPFIWETSPDQCGECRRPTCYLKARWEAGVERRLT
jgi:hypothetical protein